MGKLSIYQKKKRGIKKGYKVSHCSVDPCYGQGQRNDVLFSAGSTKLNIL